jgi:hypothetical protein
VWQECTPIFCSGLPDPPAPTVSSSPADANSAIAAGATVCVACTWTNNAGEGINSIVTTQGVIDTTKVLTWTNNTGGPVDLEVLLPTVPEILAAAGPLGAEYCAQNLNVYVFISTDPETFPVQSVDPSFYALYNTAGPVAPGSTLTINAFPAGSQLPQTSTAAIDLPGQNPIPPMVGNVDTGIRYLTCLFEMQTGYQTGFSNSAPIAVNVTQSGWPIFALRLPIGPYNCRARIVASTVSGASAAGPFAYISQADVETPGFNQPSVQVTATRVENNVSTTAAFNFTDTYLPGATNVTSFFNRQVIPPAVDVYFSKTLRRVIYTGAIGYQSGHIVSDIDDGEVIRIPGSNLQVAPSDGDRTVCWRDIRGISISFKENSGHGIETNAGDPKDWKARELWNGNGPCGAKAIDIAGQDDSEFAMWAHRSGVYMYTGVTPQLIDRELVNDWETINWEYAHTISLKIDPVKRLVYIMAPTNGSSFPNRRWTLSYFFGVGDPVVFVVRRGILVPNVEGRKWSMDTFNGFNLIDALYVPQKSANSVQSEGVDGQVDIDKHMIFCSDDGSLKTVEDNQYWDEDFNGTRLGYFSQWRGVLGQDPSMIFKQCVGGKFMATGNGPCNLAAYDFEGVANPITGPLSPFILTPGKRTRADLPCLDGTRLSTHWAVSFDNGGIAGNWFEFSISTLYVLPTWASLPG